jgi:hypothetical protein
MSLGLDDIRERAGNVVDSTVTAAKTAAQVLAIGAASLGAQAANAINLDSVREALRDQSPNPQGAPHGKMADAASIIARPLGNVVGAVIQPGRAPTEPGLGFTGDLRELNAENEQRPNGNGAGAGIQTAHQNLGRMAQAASVSAGSHRTLGNAAGAAIAANGEINTPPLAGAQSSQPSFWDRVRTWLPW